MSSTIKIFDNPLDLAISLAKEFIYILEVSTRRKKNLNVALSGGSTPKLFFEQLAIISQSKNIFWEKIHFFWGDERCVPPDHEDSNYGMTKKAFFEKISVPPKNVHRIVGEKNPESESMRYEEEIRQFVPAKDKWPCFDWLFLGVGIDGHAASLFPHSDVLKEKNKVCSVTTYPVTGQKRITITLPVINCAKKITFLVTGDSKTHVIDSILNKKYSGPKLPASLVDPVNGVLDWYLDKQAAQLINKN